MEQFSEKHSGAALLTVEEVAALLQVPLSWVYDRTRKTRRRANTWIPPGQVLAFP
jgi:predicted DNA-binding transcriptional regulator AlpA